MMTRRTWRALTIAGAVFVAVTAPSSTGSGSGQQNPVVGRTPVLVELFTSEGCSNCPAADALLARLVETQPVEGAEIVALEEHVDYWNRLGWKDPYSSPGFTQRQSQYSDAFGLEGAYTPQMVVDGQAEFVGSDERRARRNIAQAALQKKTAVQITRAPGEQPADEVALRITLSGDDVNEAADVLLAITEDKLSTLPSRGENSGRQWGHSSVVRLTIFLGEKKAGASEFSATARLTLPPGWRREHLRVVASAQEKKTRRIIALGLSTLEKMGFGPASGASGATIETKP